MSRLSARNLRVDHGPRRVLDVDAIALEPGEVTAVIGPNGAGKSTLLRVLAGLERAEAGEVSLDGQALPRLGHLERARRIGFLPQTAEVAWPLDVRTLVGLGLIPFGLQGSRAGDGHVDMALTEMGIAALADRRVDTLSGGERARVLLARAIVGDPQWLIADEPLAGLDPGHGLETCEMLTRRAKAVGQGVILTLHDLTLALRVADRVILLSEGRVVADGPPADALTPESLRQVYGVEARVLPSDGGGLVNIIGRADAIPPARPNKG